MPVFKNEDNGTWYVMTRYVNWKGEHALGPCKDPGFYSLGTPPGSAGSRYAL